MNLVGLDTMILIHAVRRTVEGDSLVAIEFRRRTIVLLGRLDQEKARVIVPIVSLSELLAGLELQHRGPVTSKITSRFVVRPLDLAVAGFAADLWTKHRGLPDGERIERNILKVDVFVVASAKLAGAKIFDSNDAKCRILAGQAGMEPRDLPTHSEDLFLDAQLKRGEAATGIEPD